MSGDGAYGQPTARNRMPEDEHCNQRASQVDGELNHIGPDDGGHAALECVDQGEDGYDADGGDVASEIAHSGKEGAERDPDNDGDGKDPNAFSCGARDQEQGGRERPQTVAEPALDQLIRGDQVAAKIMRNEQNSNDNAANDVADHELEESEVAFISEPRHADDGERTGFRSDDGQRNCPPRNLLVGEEVT